MLNLLLLLISLWLIVILTIPFLLRTYARKIAEQMIYGKGEPILKYLDRSITILTWTSKYITKRKIRDQTRIRQLQKRRDGMLTQER